MNKPNSPMLFCIKANGIYMPVFSQGMCQLYMQEIIIVSYSLFHNKPLRKQQLLGNH